MAAVNPTAAQNARRTQEANASLFKAIDKGDVNTATRLLRERQVELWARHQSNSTLVEYARGLARRFTSLNDQARAKPYLDIVAAIERELAVVMRDAVVKSNEELAKVLVGAGADAYQGNQADPLGLVGVAAQFTANPAILHLLVASHKYCAGALEQIDGHGYSALQIAQRCANNATAAAIAWIMNGRLVECARIGDEGSRERFRRLLSMGASIESADADGNTPLCHAVLARQTEFVRFLLAIGADSSHKNKAGKNAYAISLDLDPRPAQLVTALRAHEASSALRTAILTRGTELTAADVREFVNKGADVNHCDGLLDSILHLCVRHGCTPDVLRMLVGTLRANIEAVNVANNRPVEEAIAAHNVGALDVLFSLGAEVVRSHGRIIDCAAASGSSASLSTVRSELNRRMWLMVQGNDIAGIRAMHACGAELASVAPPSSPVATNSDASTESAPEYTDASPGNDATSGWTVLHYAASVPLTDVIRVLAELGAIMDCQSASGMTPLLIACERGHLDAVTLLHTLGADIQLCDAAGDTALLVAVRGGHAAIVEYLVLWGADTAHENERKECALGIATAKENASLTSFFEALSFNAEELCAEPFVSVRGSIDLAPVAVAVQIQPLRRESSPFELSAIEAGNRNMGMLKGTPNDLLRKATNEVQLNEVRRALAEGADVTHRRNNETCIQSAHRIAEMHRTTAEMQRMTPIMYNDSIAKQRAALDVAAEMQRHLDDLFADAVAKQPVETLRALHAAGANIAQARGPFGFVGIAASARDEPSILDFLVRNSADNSKLIEHRTQNGETVISLARSKNNRNVVAYVIWVISTRLSSFVGKLNVAAVRYLHSIGALPECEHVPGQRSANLHAAVSTGNLELVRFLAQIGADIDWRGADGRTLSQFAASIGHIAIAKFLAGQERDHALRVAAASGDFASVRRIHAGGADINALNFEGSTAVSMCALHGDYIGVIKYLVERGASVVHRNVNLPTLVKMARDKGHGRVAAYVSGCVNAQFVRAARRGDVEAMGDLYALGVDMQYEEAGGHTALAVAASAHGLDVVQWLVLHGAEPNLPTSSGDYVLGLASAKGDYAMVKFLVEECRADTSALNGEGKTAAEIARANGNIEVAKYLNPADAAELDKLSASAKATAAAGDKPPKRTTEELLEAVRRAHLPVVREFEAEVYASLALKTEHCERMLLLARQLNQFEVVRLLEPHYLSLTSKADSTKTQDRLFAGSKEHAILLGGFLKGLSAHVTGGDVQIDPGDPRTFDALFNNMQGRVVHERERLNDAATAAAVLKQYREDSERLQREMASLSESRREMEFTRGKFVRQLSELEQRLNSAKSARERVAARKELEELRAQTGELNAQMTVLYRAHEVREARAKVLQTFKEDPSTFLYYRTVSLAIHDVFVSSKAAAGGMVQVETGDMHKAAVAVSLLGKVMSIIPAAGSAGSCICNAAAVGLDFLDKKRQIATAKGISMLASVSEAERVSDETARKLTLWYWNQIGLLERPDSKAGARDPTADLPARMFAEYAVLRIVRALNKSLFDSSRPLDDQFVWTVVSKDPFAKRSLLERIGVGIGSKKISLTNGEKTDLRSLYGLCGLMVDNGDLYTNDKSEVSKYGYCYGTILAAKGRGLSRSGHGPCPAKLFRPSIDSFDDDEKAVAAAISSASTSASASASANAGSSLDPAPSLNDKERKSADVARLVSSGMTKGKVREEIKAVLRDEELAREMIESRIAEANASTRLYAQEEVEGLREALEESTTSFHDKVDAITETVNSGVTVMQAEVKACKADVASTVSRANAELKAVSDGQLRELNATVSTATAALESTVRKAVDDSDKRAESLRLEIGNAKNDLRSQHASASAELRQLFEALRNESNESHTRWTQGQEARFKVLEGKVAAQQDALYSAASVKLEGLANVAAETALAAKQVADGALSLAEDAMRDARAAAEAVVVAAQRAETAQASVSEMAEAVKTALKRAETAEKMLKDVEKRTVDVGKDLERREARLKELETAFEKRSADVAKDMEKRNVDAQKEAEKRELRIKELEVALEKRAAEVAKDNDKREQKMKELEASVLKAFKKIKDKGLKLDD